MAALKLTRCNTYVCVCVCVCVMSNETCLLFTNSNVLLYHKAISLLSILLHNFTGP